MKTLTAENDFWCTKQTIELADIMVDDEQQDLTGQPEKVVAIAQAAWTPEVVAAYEAAQLASQLAAQPNP